ncbi:restriction endonuclease subunit S [Chitinophaga silvisoli]|uniref:Restriction endonuclease subunit S n=2 Tax=Chitinophaga silvisoli TaxID=2291814 RepID=A0A3E1P3L5_9BACT|nr:restriction endonuclease subunit S [Chitinophaga silvisoli]
MSKEKKIGMEPELRFSLSNNQPFPHWEETKLSKIAKLVTKKNKLNNISRVLTNSAADGIVDQRDYFDKDIANKSNLEGYYIVDYGDYVYNPRISTAAPVGPISRNKIAMGVMSPLYTVFRFSNNNNDFFEQYFKTTAWHKYLHAVSNTGARFDRMSITPTVFMEMPLPYPHPEEQQKIADCLSSLDNLITAETEHLGALKAYKKGLMQNLFPLPGEMAPLMRFPEFKDSEEWNEKSLHEILVEGRLGGNYENSDAISGMPVIKMGNLERGQMNVKKLQYLPNESAYNKEDILKNNDLLFNTRNTLELVGKVAIWKNELPVALYNSNLLRLSFHKDYIASNVFMNYFFNTQSTISSLRSMATGTTSVAAIYTKDLLTLTVTFPSLPEQQKIADCLSSMDEEISVQTEKIEALKLHKKGLVQQLFPF